MWHVQTQDDYKICIDLLEQVRRICGRDQNQTKCLIGFLIDFIFYKLAKTTVLGSPLVT